MDWDTFQDWVVTVGLIAFGLLILIAPFRGGQTTRDHHDEGGAWWTLYRDR